MKLKKQTPLKSTALLGMAAALLATSLQAKPLKVFILAGQSNIKGHAQTKTFPAVGKDPKTADIYKKMVDADGKPVVCDDVYIAYSFGDFPGNPEGVAFPVGSVLLKEKFPPGNPASAAILITRMERVAMAGTVEDWKFSATSLEDGKPTAKQEAPSSCVVCHEDFEETSFVSPDSLKLLRDYVKEVPRR